MLDQLRQLNAPPDVIQATEQRLLAETASAVVKVWPENWHAVRLFLGMCTQWHWVPVGMGAPQRTGLRMEALAAIEPAVRRSVPRRWRQPYHRLVAQLQELEHTALEQWRLQAR